MSLKNKLRVMILDDMSVSRGLLVQALEEIGISNIVHENNGKSALVSMSSTPVHLVISDYNMPEMDGLHLLHYLRNSPQTQKVGFLLITGRADPAIINKGKQLGMNNYIAKPFQPADLKSAIESIVGRL